MAALIHKLRIRTCNWRQTPTLQQLESIAAQINERAQDRRMIGQISGVGLNDRECRIRHASHIVMPTASVRGSSILVDIEILEQSNQGRTLAAFIKSGIPIQGELRGVMSDLADLRVTGVDVALSQQNLQETVLDDIVDALEVSDN